jgi:hypothetical protein
MSNYQCTDIDCECHALPLLEDVLSYGLKQGLAKQSINDMSRLHKVDLSTITETSDFRIISRLEDKSPHTVVRLKDNETFVIDDLVSNGTPMKGKITGFHATVSEEGGEIIMWVDHTWSGVGMALKDINRLKSLPCLHQFGDPVLVYFVPDAELLKLGNMEAVPFEFTTIIDKMFTEFEGKMIPVEKTFMPLFGRIHATHFTAKTVKYDIDLSFTGGANTRIYNIESIYVFKRK